MNPTLVKRADGRYFLLARYYRDEDGKRKETRRSYKDLGTWASKDDVPKSAWREAERRTKELSIELRAEQLSLIDAMLTKTSAVTLGPWLRVNRPQFTDSNKSRTGAAIKWALHVWGDDFKLADIDKEACMKLQAAMRDGYRGKNGIGLDANANYLGTISKALDIAVDKKIIALNPMKGIPKPRTNYVETNPKQTLTTDEWRRINALRNKMTATQLRVLDASIFMASTGLYWCELLDVKWGDIVEGEDFTGARCLQLVYYRHKNRKRQGRRVNVILSDLAIELMGQRFGKLDSDLIFTNLGKSTVNANKHWRNICKLAEIDKHITSGAFRHMKAERMVADRANDVEIADQMGHSNTMLVMRYTQRAKANASRVAGNLF